MAKLLDMLPKRGPTAFGIFVSALSATGQENLLTELIKEIQNAQVLFPIVQYLCNSYTELYLVSHILQLSHAICNLSSLLQN